MQSLAENPPAGAEPGLPVPPASIANSRDRGDGEPGVIVLKFGGSVLASPERFPEVVHEIYRYTRRGFKVVAVVSALGGTTDALVARVRELAPDPDPAAAAALLATGESACAAQLVLALDTAGQPSVVLDPAQIALRTEGPHMDADPVSIDASPIQRALDAGRVVVVPGFAGRDADGATTVLGRGGSDLTALLLAHALGARCRLIKDVDGWYDADPHRDPSAGRYARISFDDAARSHAPVVQHKGVQFARSRNLVFEVASAGAGEGTVVGEPTVLMDAPEDSKPLRVGMLGFGTVGRGVYRHMRAQPERFNVTGVLVRDVAKHLETGGPAELLTDDIDRVLGADCDLIIELIGGTGLAGKLIERAIAAGQHVVTANKALMAERGVALRAAADERGVLLFDSAAVGGGVPMLELASRLGRGASPVVSLRGVLNGTTNFILNRVAQGEPFADVLAEAQRLGFAEADPTADICGYDAQQKLTLLCRLAFDATMPVNAVSVSGIDHLADNPAPPLAPGEADRLVGEAKLINGSLVASVSLQRVPAGDPLADVSAEQNMLLIETADGRTHRVIGRAAGRWPTAESVFADVLDVAAHRRGVGAEAVKI